MKSRKKKMRKRKKKIWKRKKNMIKKKRKRMKKKRKLLKKKKQAFCQPAKCHGGSFLGFPLAAESDSKVIEIL